VSFAENAWHLRDWVLNDPGTPQGAKDEVRPWNTRKPIPELSVCQDIANSNKHLTIDRYTPSTTDASSERGWGTGGWGKGGWGESESSITFIMTDGTVINAPAVIRAVMSVWEDFFLPARFISAEQRFAELAIGLDHCAVEFRRIGLDGRRETVRSPRSV
jgi:hypothetical protein